MTAPGPNAIVQFFEARPAMVAEMLRVHVADHTGHCRGCAWWQSATPTWPCGLRWYLEQAARRLKP